MSDSGSESVSGAVMKGSGALLAVCAAAGGASLAAVIGGGLTQAIVSCSVAAVGETLLAPAPPASAPPAIGNSFSGISNNTTINATSATCARAASSRLMRNAGRSSTWN
jgi:hypothetical protein